MSAYSTITTFLILVPCTFFAVHCKTIVCYDCTSWNPYCDSSVHSPFPEAVATVVCNVTKTCFIRKEKDGMITRGCADWWMFSSINSDYIGCQQQNPTWMKPQEWCFCDTNLCNGKSMSDIKKLNDDYHQYNDHPVNNLDMVSDEEDFESEEVVTTEHEIPRTNTVTTILPWWWWYVHWSTERPRPVNHWWNTKDKPRSSNGKDFNSHNDNENGIKGIREKEEKEKERLRTTRVTQKSGLEQKKTTNWWEAAVIPTGATSADKVHIVKQKVEPTPEKRQNFMCWDCYDDDSSCRETVTVERPYYYVGHVACHATRKCFIRKEKGVTYRGCTDGWQSTSVNYNYVGCRNQTIFDRTVEWCFCDSSLCNTVSINTLRELNA